MTGRRPELATLGVLALAWIVTLTLFPWSDESVGDLGVRRQFAALILDGQLPYRDFAFEYPPLAAPLVALPGLAGVGADAYWAGFAAMTFLIAAAAVVLCGRLARLTGGDERRAMLAMALFPLLLGAVARTHFDLAVTVLTMAGLLAVLTRREAVGFVLIGAGAMTKVFPLVAAAVALAWLLAAGRTSAAIRGAGALAATIAILAAAAWALSPSGALAAVDYQAERPPQVESGPASVLRLVDAFGGAATVTVASHGSGAVEHPADGLVTAASTAALAGVVALLVLLAARRARTAPPPPDISPGAARALVLASFAAIAALVGLGKVLSPQFMLWLVPLPALAFAWRMWGVAIAGAAALALTLVEFPGLYEELIAGDPLGAWMTGLRNAAVGALVVLSALELRRAPRRMARGAARSTAPVHPARPR